MFEKFTSATRQAVVRAVREAEQHGAPEITEEHLLLALVDDPTTAAGRLLAAHEVRRDAVTTAYQQARRLGGLSESDAESLRELGIDVRDVVANIERSLGADALADRPRRRRRFFKSHIPFSTNGKRLLEATLREAVELGDRRIGAEHLLLALLIGGGVAAELLERRGITYRSVRASLVNAA
ncbi:Clp protease N-terminal domain-containing protein [Saccharopolyspora spinosa]|uniref:ClpA/ClpB-like protein n=1 Tax=Saccharopolyspora spinosa TaxID=60894 RepID=A0A2N3XS51_SACSN|nr:Clp protease N-terminal domain-containing protein [Saccharopolyspora spinosa]PKW13495.1 ClpA/ClpB-like protein [Saccharopolyspora spinosa]